jgi:hypothetical protein
MQFPAHRDHREKKVIPVMTVHRDLMVITDQTGTTVYLAHRVM